MMRRLIHFAFALAILLFLALVVLPAVARISGVGEVTRPALSRGIDPGALFYTEVEEGDGPEIFLREDALSRRNRESVPPGD